MLPRFLFFRPYASKKAIDGETLLHISASDILFADVRWHDSFPALCLIRFLFVPSIPPSLLNVFVASQLPGFESYAIYIYRG